MEQLDRFPDRWQQRFTLTSPVNGKSVPLSEIDSATLNLGGYGLGVGLLPGNQRIHLIPGWECHRVSEDRRDWWIAARIGGAVLRLHLRLWPHEIKLPFAARGDENSTLFTIAPAHFQHPSGCYLSLTLPQHERLSFLPHFGRVSAGETPILDLFLGAEFSDEESV